MLTEPAQHRSVDLHLGAQGLGQLVPSWRRWDWVVPWREKYNGRAGKVQEEQEGGSKSEVGPSGQEIWDCPKRETDIHPSIRYFPSSLRRKEGVSTAIIKAEWVSQTFEASRDAAWIHPPQISLMSYLIIKFIANHAYFNIKKNIFPHLLV